MEKIRKLFFGIRMTWVKVIIFAVLTGVGTGLLMIPAKLKDTSLQDIGISFDCWILFALIIILNCEKPVEAMAKCFVFFLISQPLVYLVQLPFVEEGVGIFSYYVFWFKMTLATIPGAFIAYQVKRKDWISVLVLSVATVFLAWQGGQYLMTAFASFPHHLLSAIFCFGTAAIYVLAFFDDKKIRIAAAAIFLAALCVTCVINNGRSYSDVDLPAGTWTYEIADESVVSVEMVDEDTARVTPVNSGNTDIFFTNSEGEVLDYIATVTNGRILVQIYEE